MYLRKLKSIIFCIFIFVLTFILSVTTFAETYVVTNTNDEGAGSLRQAIIDAINNPDLDYITFNIPGSGPHIIKPTSHFISITDPVVIDGYTQPGAVAATENANAILMIVINGGLAPSYVSGLRISTGSTIKGLVVNKFGGHGIVIENGDGNVVEGNYIGTDFSGTVSEGNIGMGIHINGSANNTIGGNSPEARNVISGNDFDGLAITGINATGNRILGNFIGTDASGTAYLPNGVPTGGASLRINNAPGNIIGGENPGSRNIISDIAITNPGANNNLISGNFIGTDRNGLTALTSIVMAGIFVIDASDNIIGPGNVISGKGDAGVYLIEGDPIHRTTGNLVTGNYIGTDLTGTKAIPNRFGVTIENASNNTISDNIIAFSKIGEGNYGGVGVEIKSAWGVTDNDPIGNRILSNRIFSNERIGIDLNDDGVTSNDPEDLDDGPNMLMNYPVIETVKVNKKKLIVKGFVDTPNPKSVLVEFFANPVPDPGSDPTGHGEGLILLGECNPNQQGKFTAVLSSVDHGTFITATATDIDGNTSEFAANIEVIRKGVAKNSNKDKELIVSPQELVLSQNYPNPFNPVTTIEYKIPKTSQVDLSIYNILGQKVATLLSEKQPAGSYKVSWDASGLSGGTTGFASGVYLYRLETDEGFSQTKKLILMK